MKCIYYNLFKGRCGQKAFGILGGNSYCELHLDKKQFEKTETPTKPLPRSTPYKSEIELFDERNGRAPNKWELIAMI